MINTFVIHTRFFMAFKVLFAVAFLQLAVYTYTCIIANKKEVPHVSTMSEMEYTKVLMSVHDELGDEFKQLWMRDELESLRNELITAVNNAKKGDKYGSLFNEVLIKINDYVSRAMPSQDIIPALPGEYDQKKYEQLLENLNRALSQLKTQEEADRSFFKLLSEKYTEYKSSVDYIRRVVVKRLYKISPEFVCKKNSEGHIVCNSEGKPKILEDIMQKDVNGKYAISTRLLILKQFIKQFGWCEGVIHDKDARGEGYRCEKLRKEISEYRDRLEVAGELFDARGKEKNVISEFAATVDESIFDRFDYNARGRIKSYNFRMLKVADSIAKGFFASKNPTREDLYVFSIAFEMTFSMVIPDKDTNPDEYETDIRKNLFFDYYSDNLVNAVFNAQDVEKKEESAAREKYISGYGINYKNYLEVIYLFFISQNNMTALEKFVNARLMISECNKSEEALSEEEVVNQIEAGTEQYRLWFDEFAHKGVNDFKDMILRRYACKKDSITVCLDLSEALSGEKPNKRFTEVLRIAAMEIALKECDDPGEVDQYADGIVLDLTEFFNNANSVWCEIQELNCKQNRSDSEEKKLKELRSLIMKTSLENINLDNSYISYDGIANTCSLVIGSREMNTNIYSETKTAQYIVGELLSPFYHTEYVYIDDNGRPTKRETARMKEKVVVDYFDTVSGFRFRDEYGRQLQQDDFIARNGIGHFRVYDGKKELSKDDVEQLISERTGIAYKTGLMMPIDEFEKRFRYLMAPTGTEFFRSDGTPLSRNEINATKKNSSYSMIGKKEYDNIFIFDGNSEPISIDRLKSTKRLITKKFRIVFDSEEKNGKCLEKRDVCIDEIASMFVYDNYVNPVIGYDAGLLRACWNFDDILKAEKTFRNYYKEKNKRLAFGIKNNGSLIVTRANLMIAACNYILNEKIISNKKDLEKPFNDFSQFYTYAQEKHRFKLGEKSYRGLNDLLIDGGFMEVNHKNLFDIILLYFTYRNLWKTYRFSMM